MGCLLTIGVDNVFNGFWWQPWPAAAALVLVLVLVEIAVKIVRDGVRDVVKQRLIRR